MVKEESSSFLKKRTKRLFPGASRALGGLEWRLEVYDELPSTSDLILTRTNEPAGLAILAHRQTKGRGSHRRAWIAPAGNLNLSLLLHPEASKPWALLAGVAVHQTLTPYAAGSLRLKWPNDLLLDGAKLGGILVEAGPGWVVIGIGINLREAPSLPDRPTAHLPEAPPPEALAERLLPVLTPWLNASDAQIITAWLAAAHPMGTPLRVAHPSGLVMGLFAGLTPQGHLLLDGVHGLVELSAGEIQL